MFFSIILIIFILILIILITTIKINIEHLTISNDMINDYSKIKYDFLISINFYILNKIKYLKIKLSKEKFDKINILDKIKRINLEKLRNEYNDIKIDTKLLRIKLEELNLKLRIGTENVIVTSFIILILSILMPALLKKVVRYWKQHKYKYTIEPVYINKNVIDLQLHCIIQLKMVHIINVIYIVLKKRRVLKHERTSNRRAHDDSHEQYSRYGRC